MDEYKNEIDSMLEYTYQWLPENYSDPTEPILKITKSSLILVINNDCLKTKPRLCVKEQ